MSFLKPAGKSFVRQLAALALAFTIAPLSGQAKGSAKGWDVSNTGQPFVNADFTVTEGTWMSLDVSPDGKTILFDMLGDIYAIPATGGEARAILSGPAMQRSPRFSPDGRRILYLSDASGSDNIWTSAPDGSDARQITHETVNALTGPDWGAKGAYVAAAKIYATVALLHNSEIRLFDLAGGAGHVLVPVPKVGENVHEVQFSPDGRYAYYTQKITPPSASHVYIDPLHINYAIMRRDLASGETITLISGFGGATTSRLSRDGKRLAFIRRVKTKTVLFVYNLETGEQRPVFDGLDRDDQADFIGQGLYYPQYGWFPDNRHVAIWGKGKLYKVDMDGNEVVNIPFSAHVHLKLTKAARFTHELEPDQFTVKAIRNLAVSPDGKTLLFNGLGLLWKEALPGGKPSRLAAGTLPQSEPSFSADGAHIAFVEWNDQKGGTLWESNADGSNAHVVLESEGPIREPAFSHDGKMLVYKIDEGDQCLGGHSMQPGIYLVPAAGGKSRYLTGPGDHLMFSPDDQRIWFTRENYVGTDKISTLESVDLNGQNPLTHARTLDADTSEIHVSPDLRWVAFRDRQQYYVTRLGITTDPVLLGAAEISMPVVKISRDGGYNLIWSADSKSVLWSLGDAVYRASLPDPAPAGEEALTPYTRTGLIAKSDVPSGSLAFVNGRIITMQGDKVIEHGTVIVTGNHITAVGEAGKVAVPAGAKVIDVTGKTLMPGFIDMHGHIDNCYYTSAGLLSQKQAARYADLAYGVTTNYDPYSSEVATYAMEEMTKAGLMVGPRAIDSGMVAYGRAGKPDSVYLPIHDYADAQALMRRKAAYDGFTVKSYRQPMRSQRQMLIKAGREYGVMLDVEGESHFYNNLTMIMDGQFNLQHNMPVATYYDDIIQMMAHTNVAHTPTLIVLFGEMMGENYIYQHNRTWDDPKAKTFIQVTNSGYSPLGTPYGGPPYVRNMTTVHVADEIWDIGFRSVAKSIKKLDDAGVLINAGSHGQVSGEAMDWEMWLIAEGGMSNLHVLRTGTINGAKTLGLDHQIGSIEVGKLADMLVLDANPLEDIHNTNTVRYTLVNGRLYNSYTMDEIGNYNRPRPKFFWEVGRNYHGIDWEKDWAHP